jgi:cell division protein ZapE
MSKPSALLQHFSGLGVCLDPGQCRAAETLDALCLQAQRSADRLFRRRPTVGAYLWGEPGRGKTMLMDGLFALATVPAQRLHYHQFLRDLHRELARSGGRRQTDYLSTLARQVATQSRLFCLDEFHLHDVADAILMERFLTVLLERRVLVILTSNYAPESLLPDPELHWHALRLIALIRRDMTVLHLDGEQDYRYRQTSTREQYLHPCGEESELRLCQLLRSMGQDLCVGPVSVTLSGRSLPVRALGPRCVWFDFETICLGPRSHLDYLEMAERWDVVVISDIQQRQLNQADGLRRFIWLVDVLYDRRQCLLLVAECPIETLLQAVELSVDIHRTLSRLSEMRSVSFPFTPAIEMSPLCQ